MKCYYHGSWTHEQFYEFFFSNTEGREDKKYPNHFVVIPTENMERNDFAEFLVELKNYFQFHFLLQFLQYIRLHKFVFLIVVVL